MLDQLSFSKLLAQDAVLVELRRKYSGKPAAERRMAAEWEYGSAMAEELMAPWTGERPEIGMGAVRALAIDPDFAPAMLTVGSIEYQLGRVDEAMARFLGLVALPSATEDLAEVVDKAGTFLIDRGDLSNAKRLFECAVGEHPGVAMFHSGLGYCHAKLGGLAEAVSCASAAVDLEPENHEYRSDLGWALIEAGEYDEAELVLEAAVAAAPADYERSRNNLAYLKSLRKG